MIRRILHAVLDSPVLSSFLLVGAYLAIAATGIVGLVYPHTLSDIAFRVPALAGAGLALVGGVAGAASVPRGIWWLERGAIALMVGAIGARVYSLGYQHALDVATFAEMAISIAFLSSIVCGLCVRLLYIRGLALDPRR